ncbi:MAG: NADPH-dependent assimilatory sulfite reductase hemoprotein subunit [Gammaproteobacteria bacterium]|nr:NADPH-dependent assimilatory sulfite reductase hemoprotein subunit [Gammaproteobacteria bacterium]
MTEKINRPENFSEVEGMKTASRGLRGDLSDQMENRVTGNVNEEGKQLIKFHGAYIQDNRDRRAERDAKKLEWAYSFMIRLRIPGGDVSAQQWLGLQESCNNKASGVIKITTRQTVQFHGVVKARMKPTMKDFDALGLDAISACGDVNRNVMTGSNPATARFHAEVHKYAQKISDHLLPQTKAYSEVWLDGEKLPDECETEADPLYQNRYLPRKFKIAVAIPPHNDVDVFMNDVGLIAVGEGKNFKGFNVAIGGGLGVTHGNEKTYPRRSDIIGFVTKDKVLDTCWQIAAVQRDYGNREDRKLARLKYTLDRLGLNFFVGELEKRLGFKMEPARNIPAFTHRGDAFGWVQDYKGLWYYTAFVESGRVIDENSYNIKSAMKEIAEADFCGFRFTGNQNVMFTYIEEIDKNKLDKILSRHGITIETMNPTRREAIACVALPTCPLALAEGQRYLPEFVTMVETLQGKHGILDRPITTRITGCPNGCGRSYLAEIGLVGKNPGKYVLRLGGDYEGERLNTVYLEEADETEILSVLDELMGKYANDRQGTESFGDYAQRTLFD